jgi:ABC-type nitrate/sulfonate/bicarbonate transport system permease component
MSVADPGSIAPASTLAHARRPAFLAGRGAQTLAIRIVTLAILLTAWQIVGAHMDPVVFTTPTAVFAAAVDMIRSGELWTYLAPSLLVLLYGMLLASTVGIVFGLLLARYWVLDVALGPVITFLYSIPTVALVPLIVMWAGFDTGAKVIILFLFAFFPVAINTHQGVRNVDEKLLEVGHAFRCNERQLWANIVVPAALPFIVTGLRLALGRGLIGMVLADLYTAISGVGYLIVRSANTYQVDRMFVPVVVLGLLGVSLTALLRLVEQRLTPWTARRDND